MGREAIAEWFMSSVTEESKKVSQRVQEQAQSFACGTTCTVTCQKIAEIPLVIAEAKFTLSIPAYYPMIWVGPDDERTLTVVEGEKYTLSVVLDSIFPSSCMSSARIEKHLMAMLKHHFVWNE